MSTTTPRDYSLIAPVYDHLFHMPLSEGHMKIGSLLKKEARTSNLRILEVGVGSGLMLRHIPGSVSYTGIDINEKMLDKAREKIQSEKKMQMNVLCMDAHSLQFEDESFDITFAASVLSAVEDPAVVMKEMIRVTKRNGLIALVANFRKNDSGTSKFVKQFDPLTKKFLGFRLDLKRSTFLRCESVKLITEEDVNSLIGFPLSTYMLFRKLV